jgi:glycine/sarcosine N-methyltransferase
MTIHKKFYSQRFRDVTRFYKESEAGKQVEFIKHAIPLKQENKILDLACGFGRHSIILAQKGFCITGYDLSADYIREAEEQANKDGVKVVFKQIDMRRLDLSREFDVILSLSTSLAFYDDEVNKDIFCRIYKALKGKGVFVFDQGNIFSFANKKITRSEKLSDGRTHHYELVFDAAECVLRRRSVLEDEQGRDKAGWDIRYYTLPELRILMSEVGFDIVKVYGDYDKSAYSVDSKRLITILHKS